MRLFIAIPVPENLHQYCKQVQSQFEGLKKVNDFHLTLQFLGDGIENSQEIQKALNQIKFEPFEIEMGDAISFGPPKTPRGVWIECKESSALNKLAEEIRKHVAPLGYESDKPFRAHITLGRYKRPPQTAPKRVEGMSHHFKVDHFELIQSHLEEDGPKYKILKEIFAKSHINQ